MLRAKDGSTRRPARLHWQGIAIAALIAATAALTALRGLAQQPAAGGDEPAARLAKANDSKAKAPVAVVEGPPRADTLFKRPAFDPATWRMGDTGGFFLRVSALPTEGGLDQHSNVLMQSLKFMLPETDPPGWSLRDIDYIAGDCLVNYKPLDHSEASDGMSKLTSGLSWALIRWQKPMTGQFDALLRFPGAVEMVYDKKRGMVVGFCPDDRASNVINSIGVYSKWINLYFFEGDTLPDPEGLLQGSGHTVRHIRIDSAADLDRPAVKALIAAAAECAVPPLDRKAKRKIVLRQSTRRS